MKKKITPKRLKFCHEYILNGGHRTNAALAAGYAPGNAHNTGYLLLKNAEIQEYIAEAQAVQDEEFKWSKTKAFKALQELIDKVDLDNPRERNDYIKALQEINKLFGTYEPDKKEINHKGINIIPKEKDDENLNND